MAGSDDRRADLAMRCVPDCTSLPGAGPYSGSPMKPPTAWFEMSVVAAGLTAVMLVVMWARQPDASCTMSIEPARHLVLSRDTDREHLAHDISLADRTARRYMLSTADHAEQQSRFAACEAILVDAIAAKHNLPQNVVRAGFIGVE